MGLGLCRVCLSNDLPPTTTVHDLSVCNTNGEPTRTQYRRDSSQLELQK